MAPGPSGGGRGMIDEPDEKAIRQEAQWAINDYSSSPALVYHSARVPETITTAHSRIKSASTFAVSCERDARG